jgi:hypothetical protein
MASCQNAGLSTSLAGLARSHVFAFALVPYHPFIALLRNLPWPRTTSTNPLRTVSIDYHGLSGYDPGAIGADGEI